MNPMTNSELRAAETKEMRASRLGGLGEVASMLMLQRSYQLVSRRNQAELRDMARNGLVVFSGTYADCVEEAKRRGLWY